MAFKQATYTDFSGGFNDTMAAISISDKETVLSENADYSAEYKALKTRNGCAKVNTLSFGADVTDGYAWTVGSRYKKCIVRNEKLYEINVLTGEETEKVQLTIGAQRIYPFVMFNKFYFGDGKHLYVWGDCDYFSEQGVVAEILIGDIVRNDEGYFYQALADRVDLDLGTESYSNTTNWKDVTDVPYMTSNVVRILKSYDSATYEKVLITVTTESTSAGTISLTLDGVVYTVDVLAAADSVSEIAYRIYQLDTPAWGKTRTGDNTVIFEHLAAGIVENGYVDTSGTGVVITYETLVEGHADDSSLEPIRKCTLFCVHPGSMRVFAGGNPTDNALWYSEIGKPSYFKSDINKLYPGSGYGNITAMCALSDSLLVSYDCGWYAWDGITPLEDASWKPLNLPYSCVSNDTLALTPYSFTYLGHDGLYNVSAAILNTQVVLIQGKDMIKKISENKVEKTIQSISDKKKCRAIFFNNTYYLAYNTDGIANNRVLKYEWDTKSFTRVTGWTVNQWLSDPEKLYFASKNYLLQANTGYTDIDTDTGEPKSISVKILLKEYPLGNPFSQKVVQFIGFLFKINDTDLSGVNVKIYMGYETYVIPGNEAFGVGTVDLSEALIYGREWGKVWGYRETIVKMIEFGRVSNTFQIEITNSNLDSPITLIGIGFVYEETDLIFPNIMKDELLLQ